MTSYGDTKTMKRNVLLLPHLCPSSQKDFQQDVGHSSDLAQRQSGIPLTKRPGGKWDRVAELMIITFGESGHPVFRATSPFSGGMLKSKGGGKNLYNSVPMVTRLKLFFAQSFLFISSVSTEQSQTCVKNTVAGEQEKGRPVVAEQSDPLFAPADSLIMTPTPSIEIPSQENLLQEHKERVENIPQLDELIKIYTAAGILKTVEVGQ